MRYFVRVFALSFVAACLSLASCQDNNVLFKDFQKFQGELEWKKSDIKSFEVPVDQLNDPLELILAFRCASGFMYDTMRIRMIETAPNGEQTERIIEVPVRNELGEFYGEKGFDIVDIEFALDAAKSYQLKGLWKYSFAQEMPQMESVDFPMELGLILRRPKQG